MWENLIKSAETAGMSGKSRIFAPVITLLMHIIMVSVAFKTRNFAALIVQKSNPRLKEILAEFDETISILTDKPQSIL